jgi:hypothetical protein
MARNDRDVRLDKRVTLNVAAIYLPSFTRFDDGGQFDAAKSLLDKHNIGLRVWPTGGGKSSLNSLPLSAYEKPIPDTKEAYKQLVTDVNGLIRSRGVPGYPFVIAIIFCQFVAKGAAVTPHSTKVGAASPYCLISSSGLDCKDKMTILHEMGHAALYPVGAHDLSEKGNLMHEAEPREYLFRYQVEAFGAAYFAKRDDPGPK